MNNFIEKTILITGATSGIGFQAALDLACSGAFVIGIGRDASRCETARKRIMNACPKAKVGFLLADLSSQAQVRSLARESIDLIRKSTSGTLDVLVNNAGLFSEKKRLTEDGIELTFAVNHLAPFLLTHLLLPAMKTSPAARVLTVSSNSHYFTWFNPQHAVNPKPYFHFWAYKVSKLSNVLFTAEFNRKNKDPQIHAFAIDPGLVNTDIGLKGSGKLVSYVWHQRQLKGTEPEVPARTILHLASSTEGQDESLIYWKNSLPKPPSRAALNPDLARRLWEKSCQLCGITDYFG